jgi:hypothetical protein
MHDFMKVDTVKPTSAHNSRIGTRQSKRSAVRSGSFESHSQVSRSNSRSNSLSKGSANAKIMTEIGNASLALKKQKKKKLP